MVNKLLSTAPPTMGEQERSRGDDRVHFWGGAPARRRQRMDGAATQNQPAEENDISVIGGGITVTGNIEASVDLDLQGKVHGDVKCATLILGEGAEIKGSVHAERVRASGLIEGAV